MTTYLVHFRRSPLHTIDPQLIKQEQQKLAELMLEKSLTNVMMSKAMDHLWMTFDTADEAQLLLLIGSLPMCKDLYFSIHEIIGQ